MMKILYKILFSAVLFFVTFSLHSQVGSLPSVASLKSYADFRKVEPKVLKALEWISQDKSFNDKANRTKTIQFVDEFTLKSGYLTYNPSSSLLKFRKKSEYHTQFKVGWMQYVLTYEYSKNKTQNHYHALKHVLSFYNKYKSVFGRNSYLEKLKKLEQKKELKKFIESGI